MLKYIGKRGFCLEAEALRDMSRENWSGPCRNHALMITPDELAGLIRAALPDADVEATDWTGTQDHYNVRVVSAGFHGVPLIDQHRIVYGAVDAALKDGRLHAIQIKTEAPR